MFRHLQQKATDTDVEAPSDIEMRSTTGLRTNHPVVRHPAAQFFKTYGAIITMVVCTTVILYAILSRPLPKPTQITLPLTHDVCHTFLNNEPLGSPATVALFPEESRPLHQMKVQSVISRAELRKMQYRIDNPTYRADLSRDIVPFKFPVQTPVEGKAVGNKYEWYWRDYIKVWEPETIVIYRTFINEGTTVVDFGTWIGPTVLMAAKLGAKRVIGFEPDMDAYEAADISFSVNPEVPPILSFINVGISDKFETITLRGSGNSDSSTSRSQRDQVVSHYTQIKDIDTLPLWSILTYLGVEFNNNSNVFIKVDIEGAEAYVVPSWTPVMKKMNELKYKKPSFYLSIHTDPDYSMLLPFIKEFSNVYIDKKRYKTSDITKEHLKPWTALAITDNDYGDYITTRV